MPFDVPATSSAGRSASRMGALQDLLSRLPSVSDLPLPGAAQTGQLGRRLARLPAVVLGTTRRDPILPVAMPRIVSEQQALPTFADEKQGALTRTSSETTLRADSASAHDIEDRDTRLSVLKQLNLLDSKDASTFEALQAGTDERLAKLTAIRKYSGPVLATTGIATYAIGTSTAASGHLPGLALLAGTVGSVAAAFKISNEKATQTAIHELLPVLDDLQRTLPAELQRALGELEHHPAFVGGSHAKQVKALFQAPQRLELLCRLFSPEPANSDAALNKLRWDLPLNRALLSLRADDLNEHEVGDDARVIAFWEGLRTMPPSTTFRGNPEDIEAKAAG